MSWRQSPQIYSFHNVDSGELDSGCWAWVASAFTRRAVLLIQDLSFFCCFAVKDINHTPQLLGCTEWGWMWPLGMVLLIPALRHEMGTHSLTCYGLLGHSSHLGSSPEPRGERDLHPYPLSLSSEPGADWVILTHESEKHAGFRMRLLHPRMVCGFTLPPLRLTTELARKYPDSQLGMGSRQSCLQHSCHSDSTNESQNLMAALPSVGWGLRGTQP